MEFGIFIQHPVFAHHREGNPNYEHQVIMQEIALVEAADRAGFKYVWITEHHFLDEYSHCSNPASAIFWKPKLYASEWWIRFLNIALARLPKASTIHFE